MKKEGVGGLPNGAVELVWCLPFSPGRIKRGESLLNHRADDIENTLTKFITGDGLAFGLPGGVREQQKKTSGG